MAVLLFSANRLRDQAKTCDGFETRHKSVLWVISAARESSNGRCDLLALAFKKDEDDGGNIVACDPKEARSADQAIRMAASLAVEEGHCGAIAFSRTGDPALGDFEDAVILKTVGEVDVGLLTT